LEAFINNAENDYILSANTYSPYNGEGETSHRDPKKILKEIFELENNFPRLLDQIKKLV